MPYKRPMTKKGFFKKYEYVYDEYYDCYICPNDKILSYATTNRDGYREYKSDPKICASCPSREKCTKSKSCVKTVTRHIWKDYEELAEDADLDLPEGEEAPRPKRAETFAERKKRLAEEKAAREAAEAEAAAAADEDEDADKSDETADAPKTSGEPDTATGEAAVESQPKPKPSAADLYAMGTSAATKRAGGDAGATDAEKEA